MRKSSLKFELFLPVRYGTSREKLGDGRLPSHFGSLMTLSDCSFLQNLPLNHQLPFYSLLVSIMPLFTHILVKLNLNSFVLEDKYVH